MHHFVTVVNEHADTIGVFTTQEAADEFRATNHETTLTITLDQHELIDAIGADLAREMASDADMDAVCLVNWWRTDSVDIARHYGVVNTMGMPNAYDGPGDDPRDTLTAVLSMADARQEIAFRAEENDWSDRPSDWGLAVADALVSLFL